jgi:hypothetical protein
VTVPFGGLLLGATAVALAVHHLLKPQRRALETLRPSSAAPFALGLLRSLVVDTAPLAAYGCVGRSRQFPSVLGPWACLLRNGNVPDCRQSDYQYVNRRLAPDRGAGGSVGCRPAWLALRSARRSAGGSDPPVYPTGRRAWCGATRRSCNRR